jgi:hypothetical protein
VTNPDTLAKMDAFLGPASVDEQNRVRSVDVGEMSARLAELELAREVTRELTTHWDEIRRSERWSSLLAALVSRIERDRGNVDASIPIWADLDEYGLSGRLLYYYLFALQIRELRTWYADIGVPEDVSDASIGALARHGETHRLKHGTTGVDAGWWMLPLLRAEILQVGSLKFHRERLDVGTLAPRPWLDAESAARMGEGFRPGDESLGVHIPARIDLSPRALDATFARARDVLSKVWPCHTRRIATCQSWMMDDRLTEALGVGSRIVGFQRRFELIEPFVDDIDTVMYFVFGREGVDVKDLRATSRLQRTVLDIIASGGSWHSRTGWLDLDEEGALYVFRGQE